MGRRESRQQAPVTYKLVGVEVTNFSQAQFWMNILKDAPEKARQELVAGNLSSVFIYISRLLMPAGVSSYKISKQQLEIATFSSYHVACWSCNISTYRWLSLVKQRKLSLLLLSEKRNSPPHVKSDGEAECSGGVGTWFTWYPRIQARILHKLVQVGLQSMFGALLHHRSVCKCMFQVRQHTGRPISRAPLAGLKHWASALAHPTRHSWYPSLPGA